MAITDITGQKFGLWTVIGFAEVKDGHSFWRCRCDCGNEAIVRGSSLKQGRSKSCGCDREKRRIKKITKHGGYGTRLYRIWDNMKKRCYNPNDISYPRYGARGITICEEWLTFKNFQEWAIANGYDDFLTIDRIDNDEGYTPSNCRWCDVKQQANNRRTSHYVTYNGETLTLKQWAEKLNVSYPLLFQRFNRGWKFERAISTPVKSLQRKVG